MCHPARDLVLPGISVAGSEGNAGNMESIFLGFPTEGKGAEVLGFPPLLEEALLHGVYPPSMTGLLYSGQRSFWKPETVPGSQT